MESFAGMTLGRVILEDPLRWISALGIFAILGSAWAWLSSSQETQIRLIRVMRPHYPKLFTGNKKLDSTKTSAEIIPLADFDWRTKEPLRLRPFKPKYHLTMSIENSSPSEFIEMDRNYLDRMNLRKSIMRDHPETALAADRSCKSAIDELYSWLLEKYLPTRFPKMFELVDRSEERYLRNLVTEDWYTTVSPDNPIEALKAIGALVDDDILFMLRSADSDGYTLKAFVTCFPSGFDTSKKFNSKLRDIHKPVPGYKQRLERSMDKYFDRLESGNFIKRANWTITTTDQLFIPGGTHLYEGETPQEEIIDIKKTRLRCERQVLHRLPETGAIVFSFKTYLYPLSDIKAEGLGEFLAEAIDGLREGSVPEFYFYKRAAVWGETVKEYLRN